MRANQAGTAPWKEKIDCFSSPTAKSVRDRLARALAGEELLGERLDHLPLARAGVLRLVDEDVVEAAVELVVDPARGVGARQERHGLDDQILEIEDAARRFSRAYSPIAASARRSMAAVDSNSSAVRRRSSRAARRASSASSSSSRPGPASLTAFVTSDLRRRGTRRRPS